MCGDKNAKIMSHAACLILTAKHISGTSGPMCRLIFLSVPLERKGGTLPLSAAQTLTAPQLS